MAENRKKHPLRGVAFKAAGAVTAAGMLLNSTVTAKELLASSASSTDAASHTVTGEAPDYSLTVENKLSPADSLRAAVIALPLPLKALFLLPVWGIGAVGNGLLSALVSGVTNLFGGSVVTFIVQFLILLGIMALTLKLLFPKTPLKELFKKKNLLLLTVSAAVLSLTDMLLKAFCEPYTRIRALLLTLCAFGVLCLLLYRILKGKKGPAKQEKVVLEFPQ